MSFLVKAAARLAEESHRGQRRKYNGRPYIEHPGRVAMRVTLAGGSDEMIAAAWCHDVLEDTTCPEWKLNATIGYQAYVWVKDLTNPSKLHKELSRAERKAMDRKHLQICSNEVKIIKMLDRFDNLTEMAGSPQDFLKLYLEESEQLWSILRSADESIAEELRVLIHELYAPFRKTA